MLTPVTLSGNYLATAGRRFIPIGVNWVPSRAAMQWPYEWDPASIEADFSQMRDLGLNLVRFDLVWQWFEPRPGQYNEDGARREPRRALPGKPVAALAPFEMCDHQDEPGGEHRQGRGRDFPPAGVSRLTPRYDRCRGLLQRRSRARASPGLGRAHDAAVCQRAGGHRHLASQASWISHPPSS
jgi:hypothetical protein